MDHADEGVWSAKVLWSLIVLASENQMATMIKMLSGHLISVCVCHVQSVVSNDDDDDDGFSCRENISAVWVMDHADGDVWSAKVIHPQSWPAITDRPVTDWQTWRGVISLIITTNLIVVTQIQPIALWTKTQRSLSNICDLILCPLFGCLWCIVQGPIVQPRWIHCRSHALLLPNWHMAESITQCRPKRR